MAFGAWANVNGLAPYTIGPEPALPTEPPDLEIHKTNLLEGLKYVCHAIEDEELKTSVSLRSNMSGVTAFACLRQDFLEGRQVHPVLLSMLRNLRLDMEASPQVFKCTWRAQANMLVPQPPAAEMYEYFIYSISAATDGAYDNCIDSLNLVMSPPTHTYTEHVDAKGRTYYSEVATRKTVWKLPAGAVLVDPKGALEV